MSAEKKTLEKRHIAEIIYQYIKKMILSKEIRTGEKILEEQIAKYFNVSRTPIREALRNLEKYGLVKIVPRQHAEVVKLQPDSKERLGILKLRIDSLAVGLCVENATEAELDLLESMAKKILDLAEKKDFAAVNESDSAFHLKLAELSGNPFLYQIEQLLDVNVQLLRTTVYTSDEQVTEGLRLHLPLVEAIRKRDREAAIGLVQQHLRDFYFSKCETGNPVVRAGLGLTVRSGVSPELDDSRVLLSDPPP